MKINIFFLFCFLSLSQTTEINNSLFYNSKSPRINALGGSHFISNYLGDAFYNPTISDIKLNNKFYFSYFSNFENYSEIFQINYNISESNKHSFNFGIIIRKVDDIFNTNTAWNYNANEVPEYSDIDYNYIYKYNDEEIGVLLSYNKTINNFLFNVKIKPNFHFIDTDSALGLDLDIFINKKIKNINIMVGLIDFSYKKWENSYLEKKTFHPLFSSTLQLKNSFIVLNYKNNNFIYGLEYSIADNFFLRVGISEYNNFNFGFGINFKFIELNYAYFKLNDFNEHVKQYSLTIDANKIKEVVENF